MSELPIEQLLQQVFDKSKLVQRLQAHPEEVTIALELMLGTKQPQAWRAAWALKSTLKKNDPRLLQKSDQLLLVLSNRPDGHQRELMNLLDKVTLTDDQEGMLFETCMHIWQQVGKSPSVRYTAFRKLAETIKKYPELLNEVLPFLEEEYLSRLSPGVREGVDRILREIGQ